MWGLPGIHHTTAPEIVLWIPVTGYCTTLCPVFISIQPYFTSSPIVTFSLVSVDFLMKILELGLAMSAKHKVITYPHADPEMEDFWICPCG